MDWNSTRTQLVPAREDGGAGSAAAGDRARRPARETGAGPEDLHQELEGVEVALAPEHLRRRRIGGREGPLRRAPRDLPVDQAQHLEVGVDPREVRLHPILVEQAARILEAGLARVVVRDLVGALEQTRGAERHAVVILLARDELPALVLAAHAARDARARLRSRIGIERPTCSAAEGSARTASQP
jgi:hypothetical protein